METIYEFKKQLTQTIEILEKLLDFLREGGQYGVKIDPKLVDKLKIAIRTTANEKLKAALIGGFSTGKTCIAAALMEKYDKSTMKINQQESSDEVVVYPMDDFDLIDTPGLFGFKENAAKERYKDITRKYISEAHLILYIMNPNNPIKESHKKELIWLFKDLNLLPRTVFVLSRFDDVVDIDDDNDYEKRLKIKRKFIIDMLKKFDLITNEKVSIVAVSANPFDKGIEYWLSQLNEFKKLSHIDSLQKATTEKIKAAGTNAALIEASKKSIISDILIRELPVAIDWVEKTKVEYNRLRQLCDEKEQELNKTDSRLKKTQKTLSNNIDNLFEDLILQAKGLDIDTIAGFFERNIGSEGIILSTNIQNEFERQIGSSYREIHNMQISLDTGIKQYNNVIGQLASDVGDVVNTFYLDDIIKFTAEGVYNIARNFIPEFKKMFLSLKLAADLKKNIPLIGAAIGIAFELWDSYSQNKKEEKFKKGIDNMVSTFEQQRQECLELINNEENFISNCFPNYIGIKNQLDELYANLQEKQLQHENFKKWRKQGEAIKAEFRVVL